MTTSTPRICAGLMIQDKAPHATNWVRVSTSLVTRATSAPFREAVCSARLSRCRWVKVWTRRPMRRFSIVRINL